MNKKCTLLVVFFLFSIVSFGQKLTVVVNYVTTEDESNDNSIYYQPGRLLTWDDFKGKPPKNSDAMAAAMTNAGFGLNLQFNSLGNVSQLVIGVHCSFSKKDSWVKPGNNNSFILNHEQRHFDIAYIHTRLFIQNLRKAQFTNDNYRAIIDKIYNETAMGMNKVQYQFDLETSHSKVPEKQAEWDEKINQQLVLTSQENK